ncbi:MAG: hypothetical protein KGH87_00570 [Thaumarchaeota archaeon]|nr:hypothetical protein [Candidatus Nitrosotalea sp.]MDE1813260.1 hypothetical protein [Nitrososphaerota archaeon]MDE1838389.1 hypothetical protein [Nitrososphaerota archaeon]
MSQIAKTNQDLARAQFKEDYQKILEQNLPSMYDWILIPDFDNLLLYIDLWSTDENSVKLDDYHLKLDMSYYRTHPPGVTYINPVTKIFDATKDLRWLPVKGQAPPGMDIGYHQTYSLSDGTQRQMVCNSMILEYYLSNHNPTPEQIWDPTKHTFAATLTVLQIMLRKPYYGGRSAP